MPRILDKVGPTYCPVCDVTYDVSEMETRTCPVCGNALVGKPA